MKNEFTKEELEEAEGTITSFVIPKAPFVDLIIKENFRFSNDPEIRKQGWCKVGLMFGAILNMVSDINDFEDEFFKFGDNFRKEVVLQKAIALTKKRSQTFPGQKQEKEAGKMNLRAEDVKNIFTLRDWERAEIAKLKYEFCQKLTMSDFCYEARPERIRGLDDAKPRLVYDKAVIEHYVAEYEKEIAKLKAEKEDLLVKFRKFIDDHCLKLVTATQAVENLSPHIQTDFYEEFIKE